MAKKLQKKEYVVKVPVFTSERLERTDEIFNGITYQEFIDNAKKKIIQYKWIFYHLRQKKQNY